MIKKESLKERAMRGIEVEIVVTGDEVEREAEIVMMIDGAEIIITIVARNTALMRSAVITGITDAGVEVLTDTAVDIMMMINTTG